MSLRPFLFRPHLIRGQPFEAFIEKLAELNGSTAEIVERWMRQDRLLPLGPGSEPIRRRLWSQRAGLDTDSFTLDGVLATALQPTRCRRCADEHAPAAPATTGCVCLRHRRWLGTAQADLHTYPAAVAAEHVFRREIAPQRHGAATLLIGELAHQVTTDIVGTTEITRRRHAHGPLPHSALLYPDQVRLLSAVSDPSFLDATTHPARSPGARGLVLQHSLQRLFPEADWSGHTTIAAYLRVLLEQLAQVRADTTENDPLTTVVATAPLTALGLMLPRLWLPAPRPRIPREPSPLDPIFARELSPVDPTFPSWVYSRTSPDIVQPRHAQAAAPSAPPATATVTRVLPGPLPIRVRAAGSSRNLPGFSRSPMTLV
ncbi:hypothetical protein [Nocardia sp. NBC_00511]|uniref:hypothetical protein n=1 Tax=Nocardia sp. NBC_00511 TaxID=2903591 RepID=UPI002F91BB17